MLAIDGHVAMDAIVFKDGNRNVSFFLASVSMSDKRRTHGCVCKDIWVLEEIPKERHSNRFYRAEANRRL